jgi:4-nitrophenyl phosphatase/NagD protein
MLSGIRCFLLDMDGTFYLGECLLPGALEFIGLLRDRGVEFLFLTNNSSHDRHQYASKIRRLGLDISDSGIFTSGEATAIYLAQQKTDARVYLVGTPSLEEEFIAKGFNLVQENPDFAVLGFDTTVTYDKLWRLCDLVRGGVPYIATHPDVNCPTETGFMPDIGAMIAFVQASTGRLPDVIVGKPNAPMAEALVQKTGFRTNEMCMVGDRLYTDIALGVLGLKTVLVLSGETQLEDVEASVQKPDLIVQDLAELADIYRRIS